MLKLRPYQIKTINKIKSIHQANSKIPVLAACPGAGKTIMSLTVISDYIKANPTAKILVMPHGTIVLRNQYLNAMQNCFSHLLPLTTTIETASDFNTDAQIVIALPQTLSSADLANANFDLVIVDEAHQRYLGDQSQAIISTINPKHQLLLTGTPSKFIFENDKAAANNKPESFEIVAVALQDIKHVMAPLQVEVCSSEYKVGNKDYNQDGEVIDTAVNKQFNNRNKTYKTTEMIVKGLFEKLQHTPFNPNLPHKFMIMAKSIEQATHIQNKLTKMGYTNISSNSENDADNLNIDKFRNSNDYQFLVVVQRGILGFDDSNISAVIDMSGTVNLDRMYQAMARVVRKSQDNRFKLYIKMAANGDEITVEYTNHVVNAMLCLTIEEYILNFNGNNQGDIPVPVQTDRQTRRIAERESDDGRTMPIAQVFRVPLNVLDCLQESYTEYKSGLVTHATVNLSEITRSFTGSIVNPELNRRLIKEFYNEHARLPRKSKTDKEENRLYNLMVSYCIPSNSTRNLEFHNWCLSNGYGSAFTPYEQRVQDCIDLVCRMGYIPSNNSKDKEEAGTNRFMAKYSKEPRFIELREKFPTYGKVMRDKKKEETFNKNLKNAEMLAKKLGHIPSQKSKDKEERASGYFLSDNCKHPKVIKLRADYPSSITSTWGKKILPTFNQNLSSLKDFIDNHNKRPSKRAKCPIEKSLGMWIGNNRKHPEIIKLLKKCK